MDKGLVERRSKHSVEETVNRLKEILVAKNISLFALIDHSGEAARVGMVMPATKLLIFGSPKAGTPLMLASASIAIDLPLKVLVREDSDGQTWIAYNSPEYLMERHGIPESLLANIAGIETIVTKVAEGRGIELSGVDG